MLILKMILSDVTVGSICYMPSLSFSFPPADTHQVKAAIAAAHRAAATTSGKWATTTAWCGGDMHRATLGRALQCGGGGDNGSTMRRRQTWAYRHKAAAHTDGA